MKANITITFIFITLSVITAIVINMAMTISMFLGFSLILLFAHMLGKVFVDVWYEYKGS